VTEPVQADNQYPNLVIRTYEPQDQSAVAQLYDHGLLNGQISPNDTGADIENIQEAYFDDYRHHFWVALIDEQVIGMIGVGSDENHTAEIRRLRVAGPYQTSDVPGRLVETAVSHCREHGYLKVLLDTRFEHEAAVGVFDRVGFQHTRTRPAMGKELLEFYLDLYRQPKLEE